MHYYYYKHCLFLVVILNYKYAVSMQVPDMELRNLLRTTLIFVPSWIEYYSDTVSKL